MLVELESLGDVCVLRLHGRFSTGQDAAYLRNKIDEIKNLGLAKVLADFSQVDYIDSTGIGFLVGIYTSVLKLTDGGFALSNLNHRVRDVLELTRLAEVLPIFKNEEMALAALRSGQRFSANTAG